MRERPPEKRRVMFIRDYSPSNHSEPLHKAGEYIDEIRPIAECLVEMQYAMYVSKEVPRESDLKAKSASG